jgi:hypothetical protein
VTDEDRISEPLSPDHLDTPPNAPTEPSPVSCDSMTDLTKSAYSGYVVTRAYGVVDHDFEYFNEP